jgi:phenylacetate-CoA ligase
MILGADMNHSEIEKLQDSLLIKQLEYVAGHSPFYRQLFSENNVDIASVHTVKDLQKIPVTTKQMLSERNADFFCVDTKQIIDYCTTSGTTGVPVTIALTEGDLQRLALNEKNSFETAGVTADDIVQLVLTQDRQFMAGMAYFLGLRSLGAGIIRTGPGMPKLQWESILRNAPTVLVAVPSFVLKLLEYATDNRIDPNNTSVKKIVCIGEPLRNTDFTDNELCKRIKALWNVQLYSTYASTEMQTAFTECEHGSGGHNQPELLIVEILNEENEPVMPGDFGEVTITTLGVTGTPLIRYKTGDICCYYNRPCKCGRHTFRLSPVVGRKNQLIKYKGTSVYPGAISNVLRSFTSIDDFIIEVQKNELNVDDITIHISLTDFTGGVQRTIEESLVAAIKVTPALNFTTPENLRILRNPDMRKLEHVIFR